MLTPRPEEADRLARSVLRHRIHLRPKENVTIESYPTSVPWATGFVREARRMGAKPLLLYEDEASYWSAVEEGRAGVLGAPGQHEWAALERSDVYVYFWGPEDLARQRKLPDPQAEQAVAFNPKWYEVARKAGVRGVRMGIARVTEPNARLFGVPLGRWRQQMIDASSRDPASMRAAATKVAKAFERGRSVRLRHPNGTDLTLRLAGRKPITTIGELTPAAIKEPFGSMASVPDGSVYVAIDEGTADGTLVANRPNTTSFGTPAVGGRFVFRNGRLVRSSFRSGGAQFREEYRKATGGKDRPSFLEVGLDPALGDVPMLEEAEAGAVTVGVGRNAPFGGKTKSDFLSYLTLAGGSLTIDGRSLARGGRVTGG